MADDNLLPGRPKRRLVKIVRAWLRGLGVRPLPKLWFMTWAWAYQIANSYSKTMWPAPSEIAAQYVFLLGAHIKERGGMRLPYRAMAQTPPVVRSLLQGPPADVPLLPAPPGGGQR
jgi:hypothetical protein